MFLYQETEGVLPYRRKKVKYLYLFVHIQYIHLSVKGHVFARMFALFFDDCVIFCFGLRKDMLEKLT